jgi:hypothetical protein
MEVHTANQSHSSHRKETAGLGSGNADDGRHNEGCGVFASFPPHYSSAGSTPAIGTGGHMHRVSFRHPVHIPTERTAMGPPPRSRKPAGQARRELEFGAFVLAFDELGEGSTVDVMDVSPRLLDLVRRSRSAARAAVILAGVARAA